MNHIEGFDSDYEYARLNFLASYRRYANKLHIVIPCNLSIYSAQQYYMLRSVIALHSIHNFINIIELPDPNSEL